MLVEVEAFNYSFMIALDTVQRMPFDVLALANSNVRVRRKAQTDIGVNSIEVEVEITTLG